MVCKRNWENFGSSKKFMTLGTRRSRCYTWKDAWECLLFPFWKLTPLYALPQKCQKLRNTPRTFWASCITIGLNKASTTLPFRVFARFALVGGSWSSRQGWWGTKRRVFQSLQFLRPWSELQKLDLWSCDWNRKIFFFALCIFHPIFFFNIFILFLHSNFFVCKKIWSRCF